MRTSSSLALRAGLLLSFALPGSAGAQTIFFENFQTVVDGSTSSVRCSGPGGPGTYPFPAGWMLRNVDARTPDPQVAYVNEAWEVREDFAIDVTNCVAFSTSYYSPVGPADDWMWTPVVGPLPTGSRLSWRARAYDPAYPDGYEVRIMTAAAGPPSGSTGVIGNQVTNSTVVFSVAAENSTWTTREVDLAAYAGQSVYVGFRNNANDQFILVVDDVKIERAFQFDPSLLSIADLAVPGYSKVPAPLGFGWNLEARVRNEGTQALAGVVVDADVLVDGAPVAALQSSPPVGLSPGQLQQLALGSGTYSQVGTWTVEGTVSATSGDGDPSNSSRVVPLTTVTANELARAEGAANGSIGIGAGNGGEIGTDFTLPVRSKLAGIRVEMTNSDAFPEAAEPGGPAGDGVGDFNGFTLEARVRSWNAVTNKPGELVASGTASVAEGTPIGPLTLTFDIDQILPPGRYLFSVVEPTVPQPRTLTLVLKLDRYLPNAAWVTWPTVPGGGWSTLESFGASFQRAIDITVLIGLPRTVPLAVDDTFPVSPVGAFAGNVAANDEPSDDAGNTWAVVAAPAGGTLVMQPTGAFTYTPAPQAGPSIATFQYSICDAENDCDTAQATLEVAGTAIFANSFE